MAGKLTAGTKLKIDISGTWTEVPGLTGISRPVGKRDNVDDTTLGDTEKKFIYGLLDRGQVSLNANWRYDNSVHAFIQDALEAGDDTALLSCRLVLPLASTPYIEFDLVLGELGEDYKVGDKIAATLTGQVQGGTVSEGTGG